MNRFIFSVLVVTVFCVGLGSLAERAGASLKSDEKALAIIRDARQAIGGDAALTNVKSMVIEGQTTRTIKIGGVEKTVQGETEIALQLPDKLMKMIKIGDGEKGDKMVHKQVDVVVVGDKKGTGEGHGTSIGVEPGQRIIIKKADGTTQEINSSEGERVLIRKTEGDKTMVNAEIEKATADGKHVIIKRAGGPEHSAMKHNELLRLTLGLLLSAPQGMEVSYAFGGETDVDGAACNIVVAEFAGSAYKLYIGRSSNLPVMMSYTGVRMPAVMKFKSKAPDEGEKKDAVVFTRKVDAPPMETAEFTVKFSDYRSVSGVQFPFKWTQTLGGAADEIFDVSSYELNPANIADRFNNDKVKVKIKATEGQ